MNFKKNPQRKKLILAYIFTQLRDNGKCPTLHQIAKATGLKAVSTVYEYLQIMGFVCKSKSWADCKKELNADWICPTCQRPLKLEILNSYKRI